MAERRAVVLAGGFGTRLRPYTVVFPKPLMPVGDRPILDIVMRQLKAAGFTHITISTGYLAELIEAFFSSGEKYGLAIDYFREDEPLGTVGALSMIDGLGESDFLVMNGDILTDIDYGALLDRHVEDGAAATIAAKERDVQISLGVLRFDDASDDTRLTGYDEKPKITYEASMGVYCFAPRVLEHIDRGKRLDFPDLVLKLIAAGETVRAWRSNAYWLDIGRHDDYQRAMDEFQQVKSRLLPGPVEDRRVRKTDRRSARPPQRSAS